MRVAVRALAGLAIAFGVSAFAPQSNFVGRPALRAARCDVQPGVAPLRMALEPERKNGPLNNMAKGLINGFAAASLMFAPGSLIPSSYAEDGVTAAPSKSAAGGFSLPSFGNIKAPSFFPGGETKSEAPAANDAAPDATAAPKVCIHACSTE